MIGEDRRAYRGTGFFEQFFRILSNNYYGSCCGYTNLK